MLSDILLRIGTAFPKEKAKPFAGNHTAAFLRHDAPQAVLSALESAGLGLIADGSAGAGQWAEVPWIAIFDPTITESATQGYYVVYLFSADGSKVFLSLNQGATAVQTEFKGQAESVLSGRAEFMRARLSDYFAQLPLTQIDLGATSRLAKAYGAGHALGLAYELDKLPEENTLKQQLKTAINAYRALTFRGGLNSEPEPAGCSLNSAITIIEKRRMVLHEKIERRANVSKKVKQILGTSCQACGLDMASAYGAIGQDFIEAHHLIPIHTLREGEAREYSIRKDFAVLCPNCHRMIHRFPNTDAPTPENIDGFLSYLRQEARGKRYG